MSKIGRNYPCPCGSGLKYKFCHGDSIKLEICKEIANRAMLQLIQQEKVNKGLIKLKYKCQCGKQFDNPIPSTINSNIFVCPFCSNTKFEEQK